MQAAYNGRVDTVKVLLQAGANVNDRSSDGSTVLMWAVLGGCPSIVELLLKAGADVGGQNLTGMTNLMIARGYKRDPAIAQLLKSAGAED